jgi:hypothetical protein
VNWTHLAHDGDKLRSLVNTVMNLRIPYNAERFPCVAERLEASETALTSRLLVSYMMN